MERNQLGFENLANELPQYKLLESRIISISEGVDALVAKNTITSLLYLETLNPGKPITLYINSPGGEVNSGFAIFDTIRFISSPVRVITAGLCASIATVINCAAKKQNRFGLPNSRYLIHQPLISGQVRGQASDLEITAKEILKTREKINQLLSEECNRPLDQVEKDTVRDFWMDAEEALDYGLISKVISSIKDLP